MDETLVARMRAYLAAGLTMDLDTLDAMYDPEFENVRTDEQGQVAVLTKAHFMARFRALQAQGTPIGEDVDDVRFLHTALDGDRGTLVMHREQDGEPGRYLFVWRRENGRWTTLLREYTFERDVTPLLKLLAAAGQPS
ncbi:nuclear transport factor 2 family protein [Kitasatospora sp. NPDC088134]|uniref:nuclear transport factor 2 family protein n=1 Tax=Kitasatospora sp. NPDC088134 TaxID=3364071 RepID=UPI00380A4BB3